MHRITSFIKRKYKNLQLRFLSFGHRGMLNWIPDRIYVQIMFWIKLGRKPNLRKPQSYNEKLQWLKLYYHIPEYTILVDKYEVKEKVAEKIGEEYIIPTLNVWEHFEDIDFTSLPDQFVLKCTHDSGGIVVCKDKSKLDIGKARAKIERSMKRNYYWGNREWPYKNVKPRIIAEKYMEDCDKQELSDYKFFCFDGHVKGLLVVTDRMNKDVSTKFDYFDENFNHFPFTNRHPNADKTPEKPLLFNEMKRIAEDLSVGMPHVRVDLYEVNGKIYFGEFTFFPHSGTLPFTPMKWDYIFGEWLNLPEKHV